MIALKFLNTLADNIFTMNTKMLFIGAIIFSILASKTDDLLFSFFAVYLTALTISVFFFKYDQKKNAKRKSENSLLPGTNLPEK